MRTVQSEITVCPQGLSLIWDELNDCVVKVNEGRKVAGIGEVFPGFLMSVSITVGSNDRGRIRCEENSEHT